MNHRLQPRRLFTLAIIPALLAACGGDGSGSSSAPTTSSLTGTVATGAAAAHALVTFKCTDGTAGTGTADAQGRYELSVSAAALPCALRATGEDIPGGGIHSLASQAGTVHITPLTDLVLAYASRQDPGGWFENIPAGLLATAAGRYPEDAKTVIESLRAKGYVLPPGDFDPRDANFEPQPGDPYDDFLEALKVSLDAGGPSAYENLRADLASQDLTSIPAAPDSEAPTGFDKVIALAGHYVLSEPKLVLSSCTRPAANAPNTDPAPGAKVWENVEIQVNGTLTFSGGTPNQTLPPQGANVYDRSTLTPPLKRLHINYDQDKQDSGLRVDLCLNEDGEISSIFYQDPPTSPDVPLYKVNFIAQPQPR